MHTHHFPFAVRMIGFLEEEAQSIGDGFVNGQEKGYGYFRLLEDNLQDPDLYLVNAEDVKALATLADLAPSDVRPALLVGVTNVALPYPCLIRPLQHSQLFRALDALVEKRANTLSRLGAAGVVAVPERRRRNRLDVDLTDPSAYERMRLRGNAEGGILIVDKNPAFRSYVSDMLFRYNLPVAWVNSQNRAIDQCETNDFAVVLINTSMPGIDPYDLCKEIKIVGAIKNSVVIFLVGKNFAYDVQRAHAAKVEGYVNKPVASHHLMSVLKKFLPALSR